MRRCHNSVKHRGAGPTPPGRGQEETDKCAAAGVSRVFGLRIRPHNLAPRQGAAQRLLPALLPGFLDLRLAPRTPVPYPYLVSQSYILASPTLQPTQPGNPGSQTCSESGSLQLPRPARLLKGASRLSARAEPGSSLSSPPRGVCDSPHFSRPGAQAVTSTDKPNLYGPVYLTHFPSSCSLTDSILKCFLSAWSRTV